MKQRHLWLLALLSILTLMTTTTLAIAGESMTSGHVEIGFSGMDTKDSPARVNEYVNTRSEEGFSFAPKLYLESISDGSAFEFEVDIMGPRDQKFGLEVDASRIFKFGFDYSVMEHHLDHDIMSHIGATVFGDIFGNQPRVTSPATIGNPENSKIYTPTVNYDPSADPTSADGKVTAAIDAAHVEYQQELDNDYIITRREWSNELDLTLPALPNVTFHAGLRIEERDGMKQAITTSKCNNCHVSADSKEIDERTEDFTIGATGKFGMLTVEYEYLTRDFTENGTSPQENYTGSNSVHANVVDDDQLLYGAGSESMDYAVTPDSEKDSHLLKARVDLSRDSSITGSYVKAEVTSEKEEDPTAGYVLLDGELVSEFESFAIKGATRIGNLRLSLRGGQYEIETDSYTTYFPALENDNVLVKDTANTGAGTYLYDTYLGQNHDFAAYQTHDDTAESREVTELGFDAVYRLARYTTVRFGYEYEDIDRAEEEELGSTETNTFKLAANTRFGKTFNARASVKYQDIDDPFKGAHVGIAQDPDNWQPFVLVPTSDYYDKTDTDPTNDVAYYWSAVYPSRTLESSNQPDEVLETKLSGTWNIAHNMSATAYMRARMEENDAVDYKQSTYVPGITFWYAPNSKVNLTMAYNFNKQDTENKMCVGWYHG